MDEAGEVDFETFIDYDIEEDLPVDDKSMQLFNEFENCEVVVPDDIAVEDLDESDTELLPKLPGIKFCSEVDIGLVVVEESKESSASPVQKKSTYVCPSCQKSYMKKSYYNKHILSCGKNIFFLSSVF